MHQSLRGRILEFALDYDSLKKLKIRVTCFACCIYLIVNRIRVACQLNKCLDFATVEGSGFSRTESASSKVFCNISTLSSAPTTYPVCNALTQYSDSRLQRCNLTWKIMLVLHTHGARANLGSLLAAGCGTCTTAAATAFNEEQS